MINQKHGCRQIHEKGGLEHTALRVEMGVGRQQYMVLTATLTLDSNTPYPMVLCIWGIDEFKSPV